MTDAPEPSDRDAVDAESRAAVGLLFRVVAVAVVVWSLLGWFVVTPDGLVTRWGRSQLDDAIVARGARRLYAAEHAARSLDRQAVYGDRPMVIIIGSSITREAFGKELLAERLEALGSPYGVEKYAIDRGAPLFTWAMADRLDLRPGDVVVTSIALDNFRKDWLGTHNGLHPYLNYLPRPRHLLGIDEMPVAERLDYALAGAPPHRMQRDLPAFRNGLQAWFGHVFLGRPAPRVTEPMDVTGKHQIPGFRDQRRWEGLTLGPDDMGLRDGYVNHDALLALHREVEAAGATLWTFYLPPSPEYGPRYLTHPLEPDFHAFWAPQVAPYRVMPTLPQDHYTDYRHLNNDGRALMTELLASLLVEADGGIPGTVPAVLEPRPAAETEALDALRRDGRRGRRRRGRRKGAGF